MANKGKLKRGEQGEQIVFDVLQTCSGYQKIINNLVLVSENGVSHQMDHIVIRENGIFCIETKNYYGDISGAEQSSVWNKTVIQHGKKVTSRFSNPLLQNKSHIRSINKILKKQYPIENYVVFVKNNIEHLNIKNAINLDSLVKTIEKKKKQVLTKEQIDDIYKTLLRNEGYVNQDDHLQSIENLKQEQKRVLEDKKIAIEHRICPICGQPITVKGTTFKCHNCGYGFKL